MKKSNRTLLEINNSEEMKKHNAVWPSAWRPPSVDRVALREFLKNVNSSFAPEVKISAHLFFHNSKGSRSHISSEIQNYGKK